MKNLKRTLLLAAFLLSWLHGWSQAVSFSYLIPKNGYLSAPISPLSIRGIGIGNLVGVETGFTLYNIPGLAMEGLPFTYERPLTGPHFAAMMPAQLFVRLPVKKVTFKLMVGGFLWYNVGTRINEGNMDRAFRAYEGWDVLNTDFEIDNRLGGGWMAGIELEFQVSDKLALTFETQYLKGSSNSALEGTYTGYGASGLETKAIALPDASILLEGLELSFGVKF